MNMQFVFVGQDAIRAIVKKSLCDQTFAIIEPFSADPPWTGQLKISRLDSSSHSSSDLGNP